MAKGFHSNACRPISHFQAMATHARTSVHPFMHARTHARTLHFTLSHFADPTHTLLFQETHSAADPVDIAPKRDLGMPNLTATVWNHIWTHKHVHGRVYERGYGHVCR